MLEKLIELEILSEVINPQEDSNSDNGSYNPFTGISGDGVSWNPYGGNDNE